MSLQLRPARAADIDTLAGIEARAFAHDRLSRSSLRHLAGRPSASMIVACAGSEPVGYLIVLFRAGSRTARLYSIALAPEHAGRGHGRALLEAAIAEAGRREAGRLRLEVRQDNDRARALYVTAGFRETGRRAGYYEDGTDAILMELTLPPPTQGATTSLPTTGSEP